jgi:hypothetical protein
MGFNTFNGWLIHLDFIGFGRACESIVCQSVVVGIHRICGFEFCAKRVYLLVLA